MRIVANETDARRAEAVAAIGHNQAPETDPLTDRLKEDYASLLSAADLLAGQLAHLPDRITTEEQRSKAVEFAALKLGATAQRLEDAHETEKKPFLAAAKTCDRVLLHPAKALREGKQRVERLIGGYLADLAEKERQARAAEALRQRLEAERLQAEAERAAQEAATDDALQAAIETEDKAAEAHYEADLKEQAAEASNPDLTRARTASGVLSSLKTEWRCQGFDRTSLDLEPLRPYLPQDAIEKAIRAFIKAGHRSLRGADIREVPKATIR